MLQAWKKSLAVLFVFIAIFLIIAIFSYSPEDPSLLHAVERDSKNIMGWYGSYIADPLMQAFGYSTISLSIFSLIICLRILKDKPVPNILLRLSLVILSLPILASLIGISDANRVNDLDYTIIRYGGFVGYYIASELMVNTNKGIIYLFLFTLMTLSYLYIVYVPLGLLLGYLQDILYSLKFKISILFRKKIISPVEPYISTESNLAGSSIFTVGKINNDQVHLSKFSNLNSQKAEPQVLPQDLSYTPSSEERAKENLASKKIEVYSENITQTSYKPSSLLSTPQNPNFVLPSVDLLKIYNKDNIPTLSYSDLQESAELLMQVLQDFGVRGEITTFSPGPVITLYELEPAAGTKSSRVIGLADDIARSMCAVSARISVIPGKNAIGIELPNPKREMVFLRELVESQAYSQIEAKLPLVLGKNIGGHMVVADLAKMPHLLVAGTTGSGKSVAINIMILSLIYKHTPQQCRIMMIDPKMLELSVYDGIPHLLTPVVTEPSKAVNALKWVVKEMESRYRAMSILGVRNIHSYNNLVQESIAQSRNLEKHIQTGFDSETGQPTFESVEIKSETFPYIVVVVDEMADLMLVAGKDIEGYIQRLAQMARAAGIHIIMATQRPSVDVITGVIKANFPTRISFQVTSKIDSRTILGETGAEQLLGMGDMLYMMSGGKIERVHGPFVDDKEVEAVVTFLKAQGQPQYINDIIEDSEDSGESSYSSSNGDSTDDLYEQAVSIILRDKRATTSYLQRCLKIGYNKAASLIEKMEKEGIISAPNHVGRREILK